MGTRSRIGILRENGKIEAVYCQFDGYYEGVGETLKEHYQDERKLLALMKRGGIDALKENPRDCVSRDIKNKKFDSIEEYAKKGFDDYEEFLYLYDGKKSEWLGLWNKDKEQKFLPLKEAIQRRKELCFNDKVIVESEKKLKEIIPDYDTLKELYLIDKEVGFSGFANMGDVNGFADFLAVLNESSYSLDSVSFPGNRENRAEFFNENRQIFMDFVANEADSLGQSQLNADLESIENAIIDYVIHYVKGWHNERRDKGRGAEHIKLHLEKGSQGEITLEELLNLGNSIREYLRVFDEPYLEDLNKNGKVYEWENSEGVRFRLATDKTKWEGLIPPLSPSDETIITFYSDRNLNERMEFKNPNVAKYYESRESTHDDDESENIRTM